MRVEIIQGLIALRKDGHFAGLDANDCTVRIQFDVGGIWKLIGWRKAWEMVDTAKKAAAAAPIEVQGPIRPPNALRPRLRVPPGKPARIAE